MEETTVSAKTLDDAITEALIQLGVTSDQLEYDVIEKGNAGFLGIGRKQAVIKARRKVEKKVNDEPVIDFSDAVKGVMKDSKSDNYHKHNNRDNKKKKDNRKKENYNKNNKNVTASEKTEKVKEETVKTEKKEKNDKPHKPVQERKEIELAKVEDITVKTCEEFLTNVLKAMDMEVEIKMGTARKHTQGFFCRADTDAFHRGGISIFGGVFIIALRRANLRSRRDTLCRANHKGRSCFVFRICI